MGRSADLTVTITGTGCPIPDANRAGPGVLVRYGDTALQFDIGRSTVQRLAAVEVSPGDLTAVFVTHHHSDHLVGLQDLVLTRWVMDRTDSLPPLEVVVPSGPAEEFVDRMLDVWTHDISARLVHNGRSRRPHPLACSFDPLPVAAEVWEKSQFVVVADDLDVITVN